jgi:hypothetical protein
MSSKQIRGNREGTRGRRGRYGVDTEMGRTQTFQLKLLFDPVISPTCGFVKIRAQGFS